MEAVTQRPAGRRLSGLQPEGTGSSPDPMMALLGGQDAGKSAGGRLHEAAPSGADTGHRESNGENRVSKSKQVGLGGGPDGQENKAPDKRLGSSRRKLLAKTGQAKPGDQVPAPARRPSR